MKILNVKINTVIFYDIYMYLDCHCTSIVNVLLYIHIVCCIKNIEILNTNIFVIIQKYCNQLNIKNSSPLCVVPF